VKVHYDEGIADHIASESQYSHSLKKRARYPIHSPYRADWSRRRIERSVIRRSWMIKRRITPSA
jgi:hypothetical protein